MKSNTATVRRKMAKKRKSSTNFLNRKVIRKLAENAGIPRVSRDVYPELERIINYICREAKRRLVIYMEYRKCKTVEISDVKRAVNAMGLCADESLYKAYKVHYRRPIQPRNVYESFLNILIASEFHLPKPFTATAPFFRAWQNIQVSSMGAETNTLRYKATALFFLRDITGDFISRLLKSAYIFTINSGRITLMAKDFVSAISIKAVDNLNIYNDMFLSSM